jgi:hypothetical protein
VVWRSRLGVDVNIVCRFFTLVGNKRGLFMVVGLHGPFIDGCDMVQA